MPSGTNAWGRARTQEGQFLKTQVDVPPGFELDISDLIDDHVRGCGGDLSFARFRERWVQRSFAFIHHARLPELLEGEYVQMLFTAAVARVVRPSVPLVERISAAYALFLLYRTQQATPRVRVYVTPRQMDRMAGTLTRVTREFVPFIFALHLKWRFFNGRALTDVSTNTHARACSVRSDFWR